MVTRYLYIDDEDPGSLESYIRAVNGGTDEIEIITERPNSFDEQVSHLLDALTGYDGLILDWQLDDIPSPNGKRVLFRAGALAQEIRTRETSGEIKGLPIVLWSTKPKLNRSYYGDHTSHDLFDTLYDKGEVVETADKVRNELISLAVGYKSILSVLNSQGVLFSKILGLNEEDYYSLHPRFTEYFPKDKRLPIHEYARFIWKEVIKRPGILVNEELLAARLGIDKESSTDWTTLIEQILGHTKYNGPFYDAWPRWWSHLVENKWWYSLAEDLPPLSTLDANERVALLKEHLELESLVAAQPMEDGYSSFFQTICEVTRRPLDPIDGVVIDEKEPQPWQDRRYLSLKMALERQGEDVGLRPHPMELDRLREIRSNLSENAGH